MREHFDSNKMFTIIRQYLGICEECLKEFFNEKQLTSDILYIIHKYKNDKRDIQYILESDIMYAYDKEEDIKILENVNGIIVYENLL